MDDVVWPFSRDIGLLLAAGLSGRDAAACIGRALEANVAPLEQAVVDGLLTEEAGYRALADHLRLPFAGRSLTMSPETPWPQAAIAGIAPLKPNSRGWRFAFAPRGRLLKQALDWDARRPSQGLVVTTPTAFDRGVSAACAPAVQLAAAHRLPDRSPFDSARNGPSARAAAWLVATTMIALASLAWNASISLAVLSLSVGALFMVNVMLRLAAAAGNWPSDHHHPAISAARLPVYTVLVPLYRETDIIPRLAASLCAIDYPPAKLDIKIMLEADDHDTRRAIEACDLPPWFSIVVAPPGSPRTKPRALNIGLATARGELLVVYDAEDRPDPRQLRLAVAQFAYSDRRLACLQARLAIENARETWLTRLFALEYASLFGVLLPSLASQRFPIALGGTSNHFRVDALRAVGGWDAWNVTEDADLGLRLFRRGYRVGALNSTTWEEAPLAAPAWLAQRSRWLKGWMQTSLVHLTAPRRPLKERGALASLCAIAISLGSVLTALFGPFLFGFALIEAAAGPVAEPLGPFSLLAWSYAVILLVAGFVSMIAPPWAAARRDGLPELIPWLALLPFYYALVTAAAWRAVAELIVSPHSWSKTAHGLSRALTAPQRSGFSAPAAQPVGQEPIRIEQPFD